MLFWLVGREEDEMRDWRVGKKWGIEVNFLVMGNNEVEDIRGLMVVSMWLKGEMGGEEEMRAVGP